MYVCVCVCECAHTCVGMFVFGCVCMCSGADDVIDYSEEGFLKKIKMPDLGQGKKVGIFMCYICEYTYTHMIMVGTCT